MLLSLALNQPKSADIIQNKLTQIKSKKEDLIDEETKKRIAVFRFGVIADFAGGKSLSWGETGRLMRDKCGQRWQIPGSMRTGIDSLRACLNRAICLNLAPT